MRFTPLLATTILASLTVAQVQIPLPTFNRTFTSTTTRGFWFQAPQSLIVTGLRVPDESARGLQVVELIDFGTSPPPEFSAGTATGTQLFYSNGQPSSTIIPCSVLLTAGNYYGVLGGCGDATSVANSYGPVGPFTTTLLGNPITLTRFGTQFNIAAGGNNPCWSEAAFEVSRVEVYVAPPAGYALTRRFGAGCLSSPGTVDEYFASAASYDLSGSSMTLVYNGTGGYVALPGIGTYVVPSPTATSLTLVDDGEATVPLSSPLPIPGGTTNALTVCSNGFVSAGPGNGTAFTPTQGAFQAFTQTVWANWHDYNPTAGGAVKFEEVGSMSIVTWDGVFDYSGTTPNTFQFQFDRSTGTVHILWPSVSAFGNAYLVGFKCGAATGQATPIDISAALPGTFTLGCNAVLPLSLDASARPVLGTTFNLVTTNIPAGAAVTIHRLTFGAMVPPIDLSPLGAPGCFAHVNPTGPSNTFLVGTPSTSSPFALPNNPAFAGSIVVAQSASLVPGINALGLITSNGLELTVDIN